MDDLFTISKSLQAAASAAGLEFLRTELRVANTMMDLIESSRSGEGRARRLAQAEEACETVDRHARRYAPDTTLSDAQRRELLSGLSSVRERMQRAASA